MSISEENKDKVIQLAGATELTPETAKKVRRVEKLFHWHFPSLNWVHMPWTGNVPIDVTYGGMNTAESLGHIKFMLHHLSDWVGKMDEALEQLRKDLIDLVIIIQNELAEQLPEIIEKYGLFQVIVTGNNERVSLVDSMTSTTTKEQTIFSYAFRTENGFMEATKTPMTTGDNCEENSAWILHNREKTEDLLMDYYLQVNNIPSQVNRIWLINDSEDIRSKKNLFYIHNRQIKVAKFDNTTGTKFPFQKLNTNYEPYWIVKVLKRVPSGKNYLHYMTLDYKVYEYDLETGAEELLYRIPVANQDIFDPISDVVEGVSTIWAITYGGTTNRKLVEMNGLCFEPCFDGVELYDTWETPKKLVFNKRDYLGIVPANMYQEYANEDEKAGDKKLVSAFLLTEKSEKNVVNIYELTPRRFDNSIISDNLEDYFKDTLLNDLVPKEYLAEYQGYFPYRLGNNLSNFKDAPLLLINDGADNGNNTVFYLKNSRFSEKQGIRTFRQTLEMVNIMQNDNEADERVMRVFVRDVEQQVTLTGIVKRNVTRWFDASLPLSQEKINGTQGHFDFLSLAGSRKIYNMQEFEQFFDDTPKKTYRYYELPVDPNHPIFKNPLNKNVIVDVTKGSYVKTASAKAGTYEIVIKLTYQDDYAELQFRRAMIFSNSTESEKYGGRTKAVKITPWAYVYYTKKDDSAPEDYKPNPVPGIDKEFWDIINNLQQQIDNINNEIKNIKQEIENIKQEIEDFKQEVNQKFDNINKEISNIKNMLEANNEANKKLFEHFKSIGVWRQTGDNVLIGDFVPGMRPAGGNIALYSDVQDGNYFIKTNNARNENDLVAGDGE